MAISLGKFVMAGEKQKASRELAKEFRKQQRRESKRKGWSGLLGGVGGKLLGAGISSALGIASGGLLMPLIMGASSTMAKQAAHGMTKGMGAKTGGLKAGKFGFGREEAKTLREGLEEQMKAPDWKKSIGKDIAMSYISAGASGKLGKVSGALKGGEGAGKGLLMGGTGDVIGTGKGLFQVGEEGLKLGSLKDMGGGFTTGVGEAMGLGSTFGGDPEDDIIPTEDPVWFGPEAGVSEELPEYNIGGLVQGGGTTPTIANYFGMQGVSLGGSNKQSLAEMLGRR